MSALTSSQEATLMNFLQITAAEDPSAAQKFLEATNWNMDTAVERWFQYGGDISKLSASAAPRVTPSASALQNAFQQQGVDISAQARGGMYGGGGGGYSRQYQSQNAAAAPDLGGFGMDGTGIRAADQGYTEQLLPSNYNAYRGNSGYTSRPEAMRNFGQEWRRGPRTQKQDQLAGMFSDADYKFNGDWEQAKDEAQHRNLWILVNINCTEEFASHCLNRDLWKDPKVRPVIEGSFVFYQHPRKSSFGKQFVNYYSLTDFPHVSIIDPHTGRLEFEIPVPAADKFPKHAAVIYDKLIQFLDAAANPKCKNTEAYKRLKAAQPIKQPTVTKPPTNAQPSLGNDDAMLQAVLAQSLADSGGTNQQPMASVSSTQPPTTTTSASAAAAAEEEELTEEEELRRAIAASKEEWPDEEVDINMADVTEKEEHVPVVLDPEPAGGDKSATAVRVRTPDGKLLQRRFKKDALIEQLYRWVELTVGKGGVSLFQPMPRLQLDDEKKKTLADLGLIRATLNCSFSDL